MLEFKLILNSFFGFSEMLTPDDFLQVASYPKKMIPKKKIHELNYN